MTGAIRSFLRAAASAWVKLKAWRPFDDRYRVCFVEDLPDHTKHRCLYVVGEPGLPLYAAMACPRRRCPTMLTMNLAPDDAPRWKLVLEAGEIPTLAPSVWRKTACGCHFFLRGGRLKWCP